MRSTINKLSMALTLALAAACTPQGRPVANGIMIPDAKSHKSMVSSTEYAAALQSEQEKQSLWENVKELTEPFLGIGFQGNLRVSVSKATAVTSIDVTGVGSVSTAGSCRLAKKEKNLLLIVSLNEEADAADASKTAKTVLRNIEFEVPVNLDVENSTTIPSLISYTSAPESGLEISMADPITLTDESAINMNVEGTTAKDIAKISGIVKVKGTSSDKQTGLNVEGNFSCTVNTKSVLEVNRFPVKTNE